VTPNQTDGRRGDGRVLAVDGGGLKTDVALLDRGGGLLGFARGGSSQAHHLGIDGCVQVVGDLVQRAAADAGLDPRHPPFASTAQILVAGADLPEELAMLRARIDRQAWSAEMVIDNDTLALLRAGTDRGWGVAVVCGAGINALGRAPDGREVRFPSLGAISGDWGGGADIGLAALAAAERSADGRGPQTALEAAVPGHYGLSEPLDVSRALHLRQLSIERLGELAPVVFAHYPDDRVAAEIVRRLADEVIAYTRAALHRLQLTSADPDVVLGGGLLRALPPGELRAIDQGVHAVAPHARVVVVQSGPIVGAALLGLDALAANAGACTRARAELDAAVANARPRADSSPAVARQRSGLT
jgi:N-acetylglucosamine kinase-like BadF-type ATPase